MHLEEHIAGTTICHWLARAADQYGGAPALTSRGAHGGWHTRTWADMRRETLELAAGFVAVGMQQGQTVAIMAANRPEHVLADLAVVHAGGVPTTVSSSLGPDQISFLARDCLTAIAVLEGGAELRRWLAVLEELPHLATIVVIEPQELLDDPRVVGWDELVQLGRAELDMAREDVEERWRGVDPDDPLTLLCTPGDDGQPRLVARTHHDVLLEVETAVAAGQLAERGLSMANLPYTDICARVLGSYAPVRLAGHAYLCADPDEPASSLFRCEVDWGLAGNPMITA